MKLLRRVAIGLAATAALIYLGDYAAAKGRGNGALGDVKVQPYYAIPLKNGKTEFMLLDPEDRTCVHSLFPHFGYQPCWYLEGRKEQRITM